MSQGRVVGCMVRHNDTYLLLRRSSHMKAAGMWDLPAGKQHEGESDKETVIREAREEAGILLQEQELQYLHEWKTENQWGPFTFVAFTAAVPSQAIRLNHEHDAYKWVTQGSIHELPILPLIGEISVLAQEFWTTKS